MALVEPLSSLPTSLRSTVGRGNERFLFSNGAVMGRWYSANRFQFSSNRFCIIKEKAAA